MAIETQTGQAKKKLVDAMRADLVQALGDVWGQLELSRAA